MRTTTQSTHHKARTFTASRIRGSRNEPTCGIANKYTEWFKANQSENDEKRLKKADFYGDIAALSGVTEGTHKFAGRQLDVFLGIILKG